MYPLSITFVKLYDKGLLFSVAGVRPVAKSTIYCHRLLVFPILLYYFSILAMNLY